MFKLLVLCSVLALAAAKPGYLAYNAVPSVGVVPAVSVVPGYSSLSQYSTDVVHGSPVVPAVYSAAYVPSVAPGVVAHHLGKRSVVAPVAYSAVSPVVAGPVVSPLAARTVVSPLAYPSSYVSTYGAGVVPAYGYSSVYPRALSVHPW